jgi:AcrR family transcriptional regulator
MSKSERTRQFIIEKAAPVFNEKGFAGTSMSDLTEVTGLTKGSIYGNFENKDEVALAVFDYNFRLVSDHIKSKMSEKATITEKLLVYPEVYRNFLSLPFLQGGCPLANTAIEADDNHPLLKAKAAEALNTWRESLNRLLKKGIELGELKSDLDTTEAVAVLAGLIQGAVLQTKLSGKLNFLNAAMNFLEKTILNLKN